MSASLCHMISPDIISGHVIFTLGSHGVISYLITSGISRVIRAFQLNPSAKEFTPSVSSKEFTPLVAELVMQASSSYKTYLNADTHPLSFPPSPSLRVLPYLLPLKVPRPFIAQIKDVFQTSKNHAHGHSLAQILACHLHPQDTSTRTLQCPCHHSHWSGHLCPGLW